jgi:hypothetical protein
MGSIFRSEEVISDMDDYVHKPDRLSSSQVLQEPWDGNHTSALDYTHKPDRLSISTPDSSAQEGVSQEQLNGNYTSALDMGSIFRSEEVMSDKDGYVHKPDRLSNSQVLQEPWDGNHTLALDYTYKPDGLSISTPDSSAQEGVSQEQLNGNYTSALDITADVQFPDGSDISVAVGGESEYRTLDEHTSQTMSVHVNPTPPASEDSESTSRINTLQPALESDHEQDVSVLEHMAFYLQDYQHDYAGCLNYLLQELPEATLPSTLTEGDIERWWQALIIKQNAEIGDPSQRLLTFRIICYLTKNEKKKTWERNVHLLHDSVMSLLRNYGPLSQKSILEQLPIQHGHELTMVELERLFEQYKCFMRTSGGHIHQGCTLNHQTQGEDDEEEENARIRSTRRTNPARDRFRGTDINHDDDGGEGETRYGSRTGEMSLLTEVEHLRREGEEENLRMQRLEAAIETLQRQQPNSQN